jgi:hypothetical protein
MCSYVCLEHSCRFLAPSGGFSHLKWPFLRNPNSSPSTCSVKCPNQPKMLKLNPNFSGTFTILPVTYLPNFTPIRDSRLQFHSIPRFERSFLNRVPKSLFLRLNSNQAHTSLIFTYINLFSFGYNSRRGSVPPALLRWVATFTGRFYYSSQVFI